MDKYYHFTSCNNFYSIVRLGLLPQTGFRCYSIRDNSHGVFLSKGIDKSIQMLALMLSYYEKLAGFEGNKMIFECMSDIQILKQSIPYLKIINDINECLSEIQTPKQGTSYLKIINDIDECISEIQALQQGIPDSKNMNDINECLFDIKRAIQVKNCRNFDGYLGGCCCLLSIEGIKADDESVLNNCRYDGSISPFNISLVNIKKKDTDYYIYDFKAVLSYLMYLFPMEEVLKTVPYENHNDIKKLYYYRNTSGYLWFKPDDYELIEIPLMKYEQDYQLKRALNIY